MTHPMTHLLRYRTRTTAALAVGTIAVSMLTAGCSGNSSSNGSKSGTVASLPAENLNAVPYANLKSGGTLRIAFSEFPSQFNFNQVNGPLTSTSFIMSSLMPTPFLSDDTGTPLADPAYVASYNVVAADKAKNVSQSVTLNLNPKAVWSDGTPITAHDYIVQWEALNGSNAKFDPAGTTGFNDIGSVAQGSSPYQVTYTFSTPFGEWYSLFGILYPAAYNSSPSLFDTGYLNKIPVTAGPFELGGIDQSSQTVTLVRNPKFWWRPAKLDKIVIETLSESAAVQALANGELDNDEIYNVSEYDKVKNTPGIAARIASSATWPDVVFSAKNPITADVKVREALEMAVDRPAVITSQMKGLPVPPIQPLDNHILLPTEKGYQDNSGQYGQYDPKAAEQLLTQEGWIPGAGGVRYKDGKPMQLTISIASGDDIASSVAQLVQQMYAVVGLKTTIQTIDSNNFYNEYFNTGNFQMSVVVFTDTPDPISGMEATFQSPQGSNVFQNPGGIYEPQIDSLFNRALNNTNLQQSHALANQADALIWQEGHDVPLFSEPDIEMQKANLANYGAFGLSLPDVTQIGYTS